MDENEAQCGEESAPRRESLQESLLRRRARLEVQLSYINAALAVIETDPAKCDDLYKLLRLAERY